MCSFLVLVTNNRYGIRLHIYGQTSKMSIWINAHRINKSKLKTASNHYLQNLIWLLQQQQQHQTQSESKWMWKLNGMEWIHWIVWMIKHLTCVWKQWIMVHKHFWRRTISQLFISRALSFERKTIRFWIQIWSFC